MRLNFLQAFVLTVDTGSMAGASRRLNISPATVAQQIDSLESEIGAKLVTRSGKTVRPTEAGHRLLDQSRLLINEMAKLRMLANGGEISGLLRLGSINTALESLVPRVIARLVSAYPALSFHITYAQSSELFDEVVRGDIDAAVCLHPKFDLPKTLAWQLLREEKFVLIAPLDHVDQEPHELLRTKPFIRYDRKQWGGLQVDHYLKEAHITPRECIELSHLGAIASFVSQGVGVALVPDTAMPPSIASKIAKIALPLETQSRQLGILWQRSSMQEKPIRVFVDQAVALCNSVGPQY